MAVQVQVKGAWLGRSNDNPIDQPALAQSRGVADLIRGIDVCPAMQFVDFQHVMVLPQRKRHGSEMVTAGRLPPPRKELSS